MNFESIIDDAIKNNKALRGSFSGPINKDGSKVKIKTIVMKGEAHLQIEKFIDKKAFHENIAMGEAKAKLVALMNEYKQLFITIDDDSYQVFNNKGKIKAISTKTEKKAKALDKIDTSKKIRILDFGCGKAYLTFAVYYYLKNIRKVDFYIEGLDLKEDVVNDLNRIKDALHYEEINFVCKDIKDYDKSDDIDIMLTLHACDIATDIALKKAVELNATLILSVPCCQKELFPKIHSDDLNGVLKHGILKERVAAIVTDSLRSLYLEKNGYKSEIIEFIDMDHTPKNLMIRAFKDKANPHAEEEYKRIKEIFGLENIFIEG